MDCISKSSVSFRHQPRLGLDVSLCKQVNIAPLYLINPLHHQIGWHNTGHSFWGCLSSTLEKSHNNNNSPRMFNISLVAGRYPVMLFKFKNLRGDSYQKVMLAMKNLIFLQFKRYAWLLKKKIGYANKKMYIQYLKMNIPDDQFIKTGIILKKPVLQNILFSKIHFRSPSFRLRYVLI